MSKFIRFSLVRDPLLIISNKDLESVNRCMGTARCNACSICERIAYASSSIFQKGITSADRTDLATRRDLQLLKEIGTAELDLSTSRIILPSCDGKSELFAKPASE